MKNCSNFLKDSIENIGSKIATFQIKSDSLKIFKMHFIESFTEDKKSELTFNLKNYFFYKHKICHYNFLKAQIQNFTPKKM